MQMTKKILFFFLSLIVLFSNCQREPQEVAYEVLLGTESAYTLTQFKESLSAEYAVDFDSALALFQYLGIEGLDNLKNVFSDECSYKTVAIKYRSVDVSGKPIWLSGRLYYRIDASGNMVEPTHIVLSNHHTECDNSRIPSQSIGVEAGIVHNGGIVVVPDYLGYGVSVNNVHPYGAPEITARNSLDMIRATKQFMKDNGLSVGTQFPIYNIGYSQGGAAALAVAKYVQTKTRLQSEFNLAGSYCGGGPYSMATMFRDFIETDNCLYPLSVPLMVVGLKAAFPKIIQDDCEKFLSEEMLNSGIMEKVFSKQFTTDQLNEEICQIFNSSKGMSVKTSLMLSKGACTPGNKLYEQLLKATEACELAKGWTPETPVHFIHAESDDVVPYYNFELVKENLSNALTTFETWNYVFLPGHKLNAILYYARVCCGAYLEPHTIENK